MREVVILQRVLKNYRVPFFELLRKTLLNDNIKLKVIHGSGWGAENRREDVASLEWATEINNIYLPLGFLWQPCWKYIKNADLVIFEQANRYLLNYVLMFRRLFSPQKVAFLGHGLTLQKPRSSINNIFKKLMIGNVDWWFAYTESVGKLVISQGFPGERVTAFQNSVDTHGLLEAKEAFSAITLKEYKEKIRLGDGPVGIFCGSMYKEKRIRFLLDACDQIKKVIPSFEMIFLGAGIEDYLVKEKSKKDKWIHCLGSCFNSDKVAYFLLADIFLLPGLVGLAVLDSFALETPIVTTTYPYHSPEVDYIRNGINGLIVEDNLQSYVEGVKDLLLDRKKLSNLKAGCRESVSYYSLENMVERFRTGVVSCLNHEKIR